MLVTINTDASWSPRWRAASFAFWIVSNSGKVCKAGMLKGEIPSPDHAELSCIANAMHCLLEQKWPEITSIIINTDSMNSIHVLNNDRSKRIRYNLTDAHFNLLRTHIFNKLPPSIKVDPRHIKAHVSTASKREYVNEWCDQEAKFYLKKWHKSQGR